LISAATRTVPGSPTARTSTNPLTTTPTAAPRLFVKYSIATVRPGRSGNARSTPAVISGNVIPSRIDCGRISRAHKDHLKAPISTLESARRAKTWSYASAVAAVKTSWKMRPSTPIAASVRAYPRRRFRTRPDHRLEIHEPTAIPPMKMARTSVCAYAACPRNSFR